MTCGLCCQRYDWIPISTEEYWPIAEIVLDIDESDALDGILVAKDKYGKIRMQKGCYSLAIVDGACKFFDRATKRCKIYSVRPASCSEYERGGRQCQEVLRRAAKTKEER